ncbi:tetraspanin 34a [Nelusetta ayraudi]|uniref:tetraspanin 34a n=1 Tax=Nelusetta ayraudi TaxID=303726 RepID=UPI003F6E6908
MCCKGFLKIMMFLFNGGIFLAGAVILGVGIWVTVDSSSLLGILDSVKDAPSQLSHLASVGYLLIAVGAFLLLIGFLGCCGAVRESRCMLLTFFIIVLIIFLIEVAGAIVLFVFQNVADELLRGVTNSVKATIEKDYGNDHALTDIWNSTMTTLKCCGFTNYTDFTGSPFVQNNGQLYPHQCCNSTLSSCNQNQAIDSKINGCLDTIIQLIEDNAIIIAGVAIGIAVLEIAAMVVSMVLYKDIGSKA